MKTFIQFSEAWENRIEPSSRDKGVVAATKYHSPTDYEKNSTKVGHVGDLELHASATSGGGIKHFTWHPKDKKIHHIVYAAQNTPIEGGSHRLMYLSAHKRTSSPVKMKHVYHAILNNGHELVGTSHSVSAKKLWHSLVNDGVVHGEHPSGKKQKINPGDPTHALYGDKTPEGKKVGRMTLVASKRELH